MDSIRIGARRWCIYSYFNTNQYPNIHSYRDANKYPDNNTITYADSHPNSNSFQYSYDWAVVYAYKYANGYT